MKKKVLFLINTLRDGGAEKILVDIVNNLNSQKYDIEVKLIYNKGVYLNKLNDNVKLSSIAGVPGEFLTNWVSRLLPRLSSKLLHKLFIKKKYDVEIAFLEGYATKIIAGAPNNTKKLAWVHCDLTKTEWITGVHKTEQGYIDDYKNIDEVICVSESVKGAFIERFGSPTKISVRYNPVDENRIRSLSNEPINIDIRNDRIKLISIGRMTYQKNFMRLLRAVNNIVKDCIPVELWILGDGNERQKLEKYVSENNLQNNVKLLGFINNPYPYLKSADLYVCSSIYEGFSTAATEAIVLQTPVITTNVSGMKEMLGDSEYGLITENTDEAFEEGLRLIVNSPEKLKYYKERAQERSDYFKFYNRLSDIEKLL